LMGAVSHWLPVASGLQLCRAAQEGSVQLVAIRSGSRVEAQEIYLAGGAEASTSGASAGFVELGAVGGRIILTLSEGDGFLARVFPTEGIQINLESTHRLVKRSEASICWHPAASRLPSQSTKICSAS
jgi:hypothetical protein